jgi:hypothetical protein
MWKGLRSRVSLWRLRGVQYAQRHRCFSGNINLAQVFGRSIVRRRDLIDNPFAKSPISALAHPGNDEQVTAKEQSLFAQSHCPSGRTARFSRQLVGRGRHS